MNQLDRAILQRKADCEQRSTLNLDQIEHVFGVVEHLKTLDPPAMASLMFAQCIILDIRARPDVVRVLDQARRLLESGWKEDRDDTQEKPAPLP
ncbi:MAG: hypothetical protein NTW96_27650 [Planctomycetia bacterium]|nr:hypothetical protein [Planctomycetia bacterium]